MHKEQFPSYCLLSVWSTICLQLLYVLYVIKGKFVIERVMKDSEPCTLHAEEGSHSRSHLTVQRRSNRGWCHNTLRNVRLGVWDERQSCMWSGTCPPTIRKKESVLSWCCYIVCVYTLLEELPVIILTIYCSLPRLWHSSGSMATSQIPQSFPRTSTRWLWHYQCSALCGNITLWWI